MITLYNTTDRRVLSFVETLKFHYDFHPESNRFRLMHWNALCALAFDIKENGLEEKIKLFKGKVLDGRNRYIACLMVGVTPEFEQLPEDTNSKQYVWTLNYHRRDHSTAEKARIGLEFLKEERELAAERKKATQFKKNNTNNPKRQKTAVRTNLVRTVNPEDKGRSIRKAAKRAEMSPNELGKYEKITIMAEKDDKIKNYLIDFDLGYKTINEIYDIITVKSQAKPKKKGKKTDKSPVVVPQEKELNLLKECEDFRAAPCPHCMGQIIACKSDIKNGNLILKKECPAPCNNFEE